MRITSPPTTAHEVGALLEAVLDGPLRVGVRAWDGSHWGPHDGPTIVLRSPRALRHLVWAPGELGLARAFVAGDLDLEGDVHEALSALLEVVPVGGRVLPHARIVTARRAHRLHALGPRPAVPPEELPRLRGSRHTSERDSRVVRHHYDVGNDFYRLVLGPTMVYSCAWFTDPGAWPTPPAELDTAQRAKLDLVCRKLGLRPGTRLLDVGCGWGALAIHAATEYGVKAVGITLSPEQAQLARERVSAAGLDGRVEIRVQDYRDLDDEPYDAVASLGMAEHVGRVRFGAYAATLAEAVRPGGRVLNHMIVSHEGPRAPHPFIDRYVFPDGELLSLGEEVTALEAAGLEIRDVQALREHYPRTLRHWVARLQAGWEDAVTQVGEGRARVWLLYMAASVASFESGRIGVDQVLAVRPLPGGASGLNLGPDPWRGAVPRPRTPTRRR